MQSNKVFLVGNDKSPELNQWMAMTPSRETAEEYMAEHGLTTIKEVDVRPRRPRRKRK